MIVFIRSASSSRKQLLGIHSIEAAHDVDGVLQEYIDKEIEFFILKGNVSFLTDGNIRESRVFIKNFKLCNETENQLLSGEWKCPIKTDTY